MSVAGDKRRDFRKLRRERNDVVREVIAAGPRLQAHVTREHDCIRAFAFRFRDRAAYRFDRIGEIEVANEFRPKPKRHPRCRDSDNRDADSVELL